ncbi:serine--tRNA ligase [Patescibacteria group bacterium]|nr:serine--tRNA ligase [Patescibacteria group bacterium]
MLDIKFIRENEDLVKKAVKDKKANVDIGELLKLDEQRRKLQYDIDNLNQERNMAAKEKNIERGKLIKENSGALQEDFKKIDAAFTELMYKVPNIPSEFTPVGPDESANKVIRKVGELPKFDFKPKEHWQIGKDLDIIDTETAAQVTGARFAYLKGGLALMQFAVIQMIMGLLTDEKELAKIAKHAGLDVSTKSFVPVLPPVMIKPEVMQRMGRLEPKEERYYIPSDDLYLIGSAEHTLGPMHMDSSIDEHNLPVRYIGFSTAFRREAGSYGKDMKGILRVHQFDKLEMETFTTLDKANDEQAFIVAIQEKIMQMLELPYQVMEISTGDMGAPDYRQIDIETWLPGQDRYRETHTSDNMTDFQSRRLNIKVKRADGKNELAAMNDATASAGRTLIAIMENYQQADGSILVPKALQPYMFGIKEIRKSE